MPGHISEKTWNSESDEVNRRLGKLLEFLIIGEALHDEMVQLWIYHSNDDQLVADQLFATTASTEQVQMAIDMKNAVISAHNLHEMTTDLNAIRKMT